MNNKEVYGNPETSSKSVKVEKKVANNRVSEGTINQRVRGKSEDKVNINTNTNAKSTQKVVEQSKGEAKSKEPEKVSETKRSELETEKEQLEMGNNGDSSEPTNSDNEIGKLSGGRIFGMVIMGLISSALIGVIVCGLYYNLIRYPSQMKEDYGSSGLCGIETWVNTINTLDNDKIKGIIGEDSYLAKEVEYANGVDYRLDFIKKMVGTVSYEPDEVEALNIYGNTMLDKKDNVVYTNSLVNGKDEEVTIHYIDYASVPLDTDKVKEIMSEVGVQPGDVDYSNRLVEVFCKYMISLNDEDLPLVSERVVPNMVKMDDKYYMLSDEDIMLDKALFSSDEFFKLLENFSMVAAEGTNINPKWVEWNELPKKKKAKKQEPVKMLKYMQPTKEWQEWNTKPKEERDLLPEPPMYDMKKIISMDWCGAYYLTNEYQYTDGNGNQVKKVISADLGDGTLENPAGMGTDVVTSIMVEETNENGNVVRVANPIRVRLVDYRVSQEAIDYFESKDERNRGYDVKSEVQYACYTFEVTNLSSDVLTIYDDSSLADSLANVSPRTGTIYGMQESCILQPDETGVIESWGSSTELNTKYLIWGSDFKRQEPVVWFRVLAGDIDDPSEEKGVTLNKTRFESDSNDSSEEVENEAQESN